MDYNLNKFKNQIHKLNRCEAFPSKAGTSTDNNYQLPLLAKGLTTVKFMYWFLYFFKL